MATVTSKNDPAPLGNDSLAWDKPKTIAECLAKRKQIFFEEPPDLSDRDVRKKNAYKTLQLC